MYDLVDPKNCDRMIQETEPDVLIHAAAVCGGIGANRAEPARFFFENAIMGLHVIDAARRHGVRKFVQIGTVCSYPKFADPPFSEDAIWDGYPEETNAPYGLAKKMTMVQLQAARAELGFNGIFLLPTNLYGPGDEFAEHKSHVIPALIKKFIEAKKQGDKKVTVWGSGNASRDFLHVKDAAEAITLAIEKWNNPAPLNIGSGNPIRIGALAHMIATIIDYEGSIKYDITMPDGQPKRGLNISRIRDSLGWEPKVKLSDGLKETIEWYQTHK